LTKVNTPKIDDKLLYRRQYFIGPQFMDRFKSWNKIKVGNDLHITAHPDLTITTVKNDDLELALLGFMFDSRNYKSTNSDILNEIIKHNSTFDDIIKATSRYAGRWILIFTNNIEAKLLHDPGGLRQVFYTNYDSNTWCSAQPHILAELLNIQETNNSDLKEFQNSKQYSLSENCWIGNSTIYQDIYHLYPNHYLNLRNCSFSRYWPNKNLEDLSIDKVTTQSSNILTELIKAASFRHKIAQTITAGWDTRLLLAASKSIKNDIYYYVHQFSNMDDEHEDIFIPNELSLQHNLKINIIDCTEYNLEFDKINKNNISIIQSEKKKLQHYNYFSQFDNKLLISGNVSPLIKEQLPKVDKVTALNLARLLHLHNSKYAVREISKWLEKSINYSKKYKIDIEKLFYWEIRFGSWGPMFNSELDIAVEEFSPYNCRDLINVMLSIPIHYRTKPNVTIYSRVISNLWPELLDIPINPNTGNIIMKKNHEILHTLMRFLKKIGLYKIVRFFYRKLILK